MHNLIPFNQLVEWKNSTENENDLVNDYYQCLIECDENQQVCKRICKEVLISQTLQKPSQTSLTFR